MVFWWQVGWRIALATVFLGAILLSIRARAPHQSIPRGDLRVLIWSALTLYMVGALAFLTHHPYLAGLVDGAGIMVSALAAWLSRGRDGHDPPDGREPVDEPPPPDPDGVPGFDWDRFEREFRDYSERRRRTPSGSR